MGMFGSIGKKSEGGEVIRVEVPTMGVEAPKLEEAIEEMEVGLASEEIAEEILLKEEVKPRVSARASILAEYNGIESDIPINHAYWTMKG